MTFSAMVDDIFEDAVLAQDAVYAPQGGAAWADPVRIMISRPDSLVSPFGNSVASPSVIVEARISEIAAPGRGDTFTAEGTVYTVNAKPQRDEERLVWRMEAVEG